MVGVLLKTHREWYNNFICFLMVNFMCDSILYYFKLMAALNFGNLVRQNKEESLNMFVVKQFSEPKITEYIAQVRIFNSVRLALPSKELV